MSVRNEHSQLLEKMDALHGPFNVINEITGEVFADGGKQYFLYRARINAFTRASRIPAPMFGFGFASQEGEARLKAMCEALERFCGVNYLGIGNRLATWDEVRDYAMWPGDFVRYSSQQYATPGFALRPFDPSSRTAWADARSCLSGRPVLVHSDLVQMRADPGFTRASSIGMAIHTDASIAIDSALLEVLERDALALVFWGELACPRLPFSILPDQLASHLESLAEAGFTLHCLHIRFDVAVHVVLWVAFRKNKAPFFIKGACADPSLARAAAKAFEELLRSFLHYERTPFQVAKQASGVFKNLMHYQNPDVDQRLGYLLGPPCSIPAADVESPGRTIADLIGDAGFEPLMVDMTYPSVSALGLHCVRALVPGLLKTPLGSEPWPMGMDRLWRMSKRDLADVPLDPPPHFFS